MFEDAGHARNTIDMPYNSVPEGHWIPITGKYLMADSAASPDARVERPPCVQAQGHQLKPRYQRVKLPGENQHPMAPRVGKQPQHIVFALGSIRAALAGNRRVHGIPPPTVSSRGRLSAPAQWVKFEQADTRQKNFLPDIGRTDHPAAGRGGPITKMTNGQYSRPASLRVGEKSGDPAAKIRATGA